MWESMTADEYAAVEKDGGDDLRKIDGVWWRRIRPWFYRPLLPWRLLSPEQVPHRGGCFQYAAKPGEVSNSYFNLMIYENSRDYTMENLSKHTRHNLRAALKNEVAIRRITDAGEFLNKAYPLYLDFVDRTGYAFRSDRVRRHGFEAWTRSLFANPGVMVTGAYEGEEPVAVYVSLLVEDVLVLKTAINSKRGLELRTPELEMHFYREKAAAHSGIRFIYDAFFIPQMGINTFKIRRGACVTALPAQVRGLTGLFALIRRFHPSLYRKLHGWSEEELEKVVGKLACRLEKSGNAVMFPGENKGI
ncbi:MAG TPA: hypothetical protein ENN03_01920 [bacterium]|nr:hypothetical protein [bacterium]